MSTKSFLRFLHSVFLIAMLGCAQIVDSDSFDRSTAGMLDTCGGLPFPSAACGDCLRESCCEEATRCAGDPACKNVESCYAGCTPGDVDCLGKCSASMPYNTKAQRRLEQCLSNLCNAACEIGCARTMSPSKARCFQAQPDCCQIERAVYANQAAFNWADCQAQCHTDLFSSVVPADDCGCVSLYPDAQQLAEDMTDCRQACADVEADWSCVGNVQWPFNTDDEVLDYQVRMRDVQDATPIPGVSVTICSAADLACELPTGEPVVTDAKGFAQLSIPRVSLDFVGYVLLTGPPIVDTLIYHYPPTRQSEFVAFGGITPLLRSSLFLLSATLEDPKRGAIGIFVSDCNAFSGAAGVRFSSDPPGKVIYTRLGVPDLTLTSTDEAGYAAIYDLKPGNVRVTATLEKTQQIIAQVDVSTRADGYTILQLLPSPLAGP